MGNKEENQIRGINSVMISEVLLHSFIKHPEKSYYEITREFLKENHIVLSKNETIRYCNTILCLHQLGLMREILCLVQNAVKRGRVDLTSDDFKKGFEGLKAKTIVEGDKSVTNYNYIKALRNVLAHNDELGENAIKFDLQGSNGNYVIVKSDETGLVLKLELADLHKVCELVFKAINKSSGLGIYPKRLENAVIGGYFDVDNINRYINSATGDEITELVLDEHQKKAFLKYLETGVPQGSELYYLYLRDGKVRKIRHLYPNLVNQVFPKTSQPEDLAFHKCFLYFINQQLATNLYSTKDDVLKFMDDKPEMFKAFFAYMLNSDYAMFLAATNGLYTVLSDRDMDDIEPSYKEALGEENIRHIRNALQHGTYYYNHNLGVEIYDGGKKLKHITTLNLNEAADATFKLVYDRCHEDDERV